MAEHTPVAASVAVYANGVIEEAVSGEALTAGDIVYKDSTDSNKIKKAQCDGTAAQAAAVGVVLSSAPGAGQKVLLMTYGEITMGAAVYSASGLLLVVGATAGKSMTINDAAYTTGAYLTFLGWSTATTRALIAPRASGLQIP